MATRDDLIKGLNEDLAAELGTVIRYTYQASKCTGPQGEELRELFLKDVEDELEHASYLSDVIVDLGGEPTVTPRSFHRTPSLKEMVQVDVEMELQDVQNYTERAKIAEELGNTELKVKLEELAADESEHARQLRRILRGM